MFENYTDTLNLRLPPDIHEKAQVRAKALGVDLPGYVLSRIKADLGNRRDPVRAFVATYRTLAPAAAERIERNLPLATDTPAKLLADTIHALDGYLADINPGGGAKNRMPCMVSMEDVVRCTNELERLHALLIRLHKDGLLDGVVVQAEPAFTGGAPRVILVSMVDAALRASQTDVSPGHATQATSRPSNRTIP